MTHFLIKIIAVSMVVLASAGFVHAAEISFKAPDSIGTKSAFAIDVLLTASAPVNAITVVVPIPQGLEFNGSSDANSIVSLWIEKPKLNEKHELVLSGLIPGGYASQNGKMTTIYLKGDLPGSYKILASKDSAAYLHSEDGKSDTVTSKAATLTLADGIQNTTEVEDSTPPEDFTAVYVQLGEGETAPWAVAFETQDKGSGIKEYQIAESDKSYKTTDAKGLSTLEWKVVTSPAELADQSRTSNVYVKAIDRNGNERVSRLTTEGKWYDKPLGYILIGVLLVGVFYAIFRRKNKRSYN
jgi:hypothetical protein